jgi:hypothetical protein
VGSPTCVRDPARVRCVEPRTALLGLRELDIRECIDTAGVLRAAIDPRSLALAERATPATPRGTSLRAYVIVTLEDAGERIAKGPNSNIANALGVLLRAAGEPSGHKDTARLVVRALRRIEAEEIKLSAFEESLRRIAPLQGRVVVT